MIILHFSITHEQWSLFSHQNDRTALSNAALYGRAEIVEVLLSHSSIDANVQDKVRIY